MFAKIATTISAALIVTVCLPCMAQSEPAFKVVTVHVDNTLNGKTVLDHVNDCLNNSLCGGIVKQVLQWAAGGGDGGDSGGVNTGDAEGIVANATPVVAPATLVSQWHKGQEWGHVFALPPDYVFCRMHIESGSKVPKNGPRSPHMSVGVDGNQFSDYFVTPDQNNGAKSWMEATYTVTGVRSDLAAKYRANGQCNASATHLVVSCRGSGPGFQGGEIPCTQFNN